MASSKKAVKRLLDKSKSQSVDICMMAWGYYEKYSLEQLKELIVKERENPSNENAIISMTIACILKSK